MGSHQKLAINTGIYPNGRILRGAGELSRYEGDYTGNLCTTSPDAMNVMLALAKKWGWANASILLNFKRHKKDWNPMYSFHLTKRGLKEIYELAGPLLDKKKDARVRHMLYGTRKPSAAGKPWVMKQTILSLMGAENKRE